MYGTSAITGGTKQVLGKQGKNIVTRSLKSALSDKNAGNIMGGLMSTSAAAGTTREAISRGVDTRTALAYGMVNGAIEFLTEKIGYDRLMGIMGSDSTKTALTKEIAKHFGIPDINLVKPSIGEATRVLLRRIPWKILVHSLNDDKNLAHIYRLAAEKGVAIEEYPLKNYKACGIIRKIADS
jgi:hypothetical protein